MHPPPAVSEVSAYKLYCDRVACFSNSPTTTPSNSRLHRLQRSGRIGCTTNPSTLWEEEYLSYYNLVSALTNLSSPQSARHRLRPIRTLLPPLAWSGVPPSYVSSSLYSAFGFRGPAPLGTSFKRISSSVLLQSLPQEEHGTLSSSSRYGNASALLADRRESLSLPEVRPCLNWTGAGLHSPLICCAYRRQLLRRRNSPSEAQASSRYVSQVKTLSPA